MIAGYDSRFTGLFSQLVRAPLRPHDPAVYIAAGQTPAWLAGEMELGGSGAGWTAHEADLACVGEALERVLSRAMPSDVSVEAAWDRWPMDEPAIRPDDFVLFHTQQYALAGFPFVPLTANEKLSWVCCRGAITGDAAWVPEEMVFLLPRRGQSQRFAPGFSTGLSCGRTGDPVLLRGAQEVIERDALVGSWWGGYAIEEWPATTVLDTLGADTRWRVERPNLTYRFYRIRSPYSEHVTLVSIRGQDEEGPIFSVGSACRETRETSWQKSILEAIQGRHCCRRLLAQWRSGGQPALEVPTTFFEHALYYLVHPDRLATTPLERPLQPEAVNASRERLEGLQQRLGVARPILFRLLTPQGLRELFPDWIVLRVIIPGLQPLHADHRLPFLGGPSWKPRTLADWQAVPPHPFA